LDAQEAFQFELITFLLTIGSKHFHVSLNWKSVVQFISWQQELK